MATWIAIQTDDSHGKQEFIEWYELFVISRLKIRKIHSHISSTKISLSNLIGSSKKKRKKIAETLSVDSAHLSDAVDFSRVVDIFFWQPATPSSPRYTVETIRVISR